VSAAKERARARQERIVRGRLLRNFRRSPAQVLQDIATAHAHTTWDERDLQALAKADEEVLKVGLGPGSSGVAEAQRGNEAQHDDGSLHS